MSLQQVSNNSNAFPKALTVRDIQTLRTARFAESRCREAVAAISGDTYRILRHDPVAGIMRLRRRQNPATPQGYTVDYKRLTCDCYDFTETLARENRKSVNVGLCGSLLCKHILIAADLALLGKRAEPECGSSDDGDEQLIWGGVE